MPKTSVAEAHSTALFLSSLYRELAEGVSPSLVLGCNLSGASSFKRARRLFVFLCDTESLTLWSTFQRWWICDATGFRETRDWDQIAPHIATIEAATESPWVKFAIFDGRVRFGVRLGSTRYFSREGPLDLNGCFAWEALTAPSPPANPR